MNDSSLRFFKLVRDYLTVFLPTQRAVSSNTIKSYRECLNQLLNYMCELHMIKLEKLRFDYFTRNTIEKYLDYLEVDRMCGVSTRNNRLACIRSFIKYSASRDISVQSIANDLSYIPLKKTTKAAVIKFFSESALKTILEQPNPKSKKGLRDLFFMILMYDTGARNQEILDVQLKDVHFDVNAPYVSVTGKGGKTRLVPVMAKTVDHFRKYASIYHSESSPNDFLFYIERKGKRFPMSPDNSERFIRKYGVEGHQVNSEVPESLHPHSFRHSRSMHLYRSGMPLVLLAEWLGHTQLSSTQIYANADTEMKRKAIEKATSDFSPLISGDKKYLEWVDDEALIRQLYGLS